MHVRSEDVESEIKNDVEYGPLKKSGMMASG